MRRTVEHRWQTRGSAAGGRPRSGSQTAVRRAAAARKPGGQLPHPTVPCLVALARAGNVRWMARKSLQEASRRHEVPAPATLTVTAASQAYPVTTASDWLTAPALNVIRYISPRPSWQSTCDRGTEGSWLTSSASRLASRPAMRTVTGPESGPPAICSSGAVAKPVTSATDPFDVGDRGSEVGDEQPATPSRTASPTTTTVSRDLVTAV
jgi:hypothetical protein